MNIARHTLLFGLRLYRALVSPVLTVLLGPLGFGCRFTPTCSQYATEAICRHGARRGLWLAVRRLAQCHPWGRYGLDPVPPSLHSEPSSGRSSSSCPHGS